MTCLDNHFSASLLSLSLIGFLLSLYQNSVSSSAILEGKLTDDLAEHVDIDLFRHTHWIPEVQEKLLESVRMIGQVVVIVELRIGLVHYII